LFQTPRLRINDKLDPNPGGLSSTEQFFNVCFCTAFGVGKVDKYLVKDQSIVSFLAYFFAWWSAWVIGSEYACRYNNIDFTHKLFWVVYGGGVALMLEHTGGGTNGVNAAWFCFSCAFVSGFVGLMTLRVSFYIPEAKFSALWHGTFMQIVAAFWILAGISETHRGLWWSLAIVVERANSAVFLLMFTPHVVPISQPYTINKFSIICVLALGAFVAAAVGSVDPGSWPEESRLAVRGASMLAFAIFINFKFLVVDVDPIALESHAISRSIQYRVAWSQFQPFLIVTMVAASAGLDSLLTEQAIILEEKSSGISTNDEIEAAELSLVRMMFGRRNAFLSTAAFYLALVFQRTMLNLPPSHVEEHDNLHSDRLFGNYVQMIVAVILMLYPFITPVSNLPLNLGDILVLAISAAGLVVMHLVLKQRELETLDKYDELSFPSHTSNQSQSQDKSHTHQSAGGSGEPQSGELEHLNVSWEASCNITTFDEAPL